MKALTPAEGLDILAAWLQDNIDCESEICFDSPEAGTDSADVLPCVEAALRLFRQGGFSLTAPEVPEMPPERGR